MARKARHGLRKVCGCRPATWTKCPHPWHFAFKWQGVHHRYSLDRLLPKPVRLKTEAEQEATRIRAEIQAGTFKAPGTVVPVVSSAAPVLPTLTVRQLLENY